MPATLAKLFRDPVLSNYACVFIPSTQVYYRMYKRLLSIDSLTAIPKTAASGADSALAPASESDGHRGDAENAAGG
jgi:hypothetical protein